MNVTMNAKYIICFTVIVYLSLVLAHSCQKHKRCHECITDSSICVWCASNDATFDNEPRCRPEGSYDPTWCSGSLDVPDKASITAITDNKFSSSGDVVQIKPQGYKVKLRSGQPLDFTFSFQGAKDYPVDLYMLLDASNTMSEIRNTLSNHSENIYRIMQMMTKNVKLGFGTYVDKNTAPFTSNVIQNKAYSFRNWLNLTENYGEFKDVVEKIVFGENNDEPEAGFEALAQVMACNVSWRENSRKVIVFLTDSTHHVAGDGLSAGIFQPYDGECYTNANGIYTKELVMDYPSVTSINKLALDKKVTILFTLKNYNYELFFTNLKEVIKGSKLAILKDDNLIEQLQKTYLEISTNIQIEVKAQSGHINNYHITFDPDCTVNIPSDACKVDTEQRRDFNGTITLNEYYGKETEVIEISVQGIKEYLTLNVEIIKCSCGEREEPHSEHCSGQMLQCGTCICDKSRYGNRCLCEKNTDGEEANSRLCIAPWGRDNATESELCSGHGDCACGLCKICHENRIGQFCECDRRHCPGYEVNADTECGGHGKCSCNGFSGAKPICFCDKGWTEMPGAENLGCICKNATNSCITGPNNTVCNNRGSCVCDSCNCDPIAGWDKRFEQDSQCRVITSPSRHSQQCNVLRTCVLCYRNSDNCDKECDGIVLEKKYDVLPKEYLESNEWSLCNNQKVEMGCYTEFVYEYDDQAYRILLRMQNETNCAQSYYMYGGILLATLLLIGIFTILIWKGFTYMQDRREFEKFEAENANVLHNPSNNPLYDEPTTTFRNPAFKKSFSS